MVWLSHSRRLLEALLIFYPQPADAAGEFAPSVWFTMQSSGETTVHVFRQELGQHVGTAFAQMIAEELELDWSKVSIDYRQLTQE